VINVWIDTNSFIYQRSKIQFQLHSVIKSICSAEVIDLNSENIVSEANYGIFDWSWEIFVNVGLKFDSRIYLYTLVIPNETSICNLLCGQVSFDLDQNVIT